MNECMTIRNRLQALGEMISHDMFVDKLLEVDRECAHLRSSLADQPIEDIVSGTDGVLSLPAPSRTTASTALCSRRRAPPSVWQQESARCRSQPQCSGDSRS